MRGAWAILVTFAACGGGTAAGPTAPAATPTATSEAQCAALAVSGSPQSAAGARFLYRSTDTGVLFDLEGLIFAPAGSGSFPGLVLSHGGGGSPSSYGRLGAVMSTWGIVVIAPTYTHASAADGDTGLPAGPNGASAANVARAWKARQLLGCLGTVDLARVASHGHSMGAFLTGELLGVHPGGFRVASHTAGGVSTQANAIATHAATAEAIVTPYQLHHGDRDSVVALAMDEELSRILVRRGAVHELHVYPGYDHADMAADAHMLERVREWYRAHGLFDPSSPRP